MAGKPAEPRRAQGAQGGAREAVDAQREGREPERAGPLRIERRAKDDGRMLILYSDDRAARGGA
jgi:hypothetical protein